MSGPSPVELPEPEIPLVQISSDRDLMIRFHMALQAIQGHVAMDASDSREMRDIAKRALNLES